MTDLALFIPIRNTNAQENLDEFIRFAREDLNIFGVDLDFDLNSWDVTESINLKAMSKKVSYVFSDFKSSTKKARIKAVYMEEPYLSFAKSYIRYMYGLRPAKAIASRLVPLRVLCEALSEYYPLNPILINQDITNRAAQLIVENYSQALAYRLGAQLEMLIDFLSTNKLINNPFQWRNPIKRPSDTQRIGEEADKRREDKMPSQAALDALPQIFRMATRDIHVIVSATTAILLASPDRINEVLRLEEKCEIIRKNKDGAELYGLRWRGSKGADSAIKDIVSSMADVVKEALNKIRNEAM